VGACTAWRPCCLVEGTYQISGRIIIAQRTLTDDADERASSKQLGACRACKVNATTNNQSRRGGSDRFLIPFILFFSSCRPPSYLCPAVTCIHSLRISRDCPLLSHPPQPPSFVCPSNFPSLFACKIFYRPCSNLKSAICNNTYRFRKKTETRAMGQCFLSSCIVCIVCVCVVCRAGCARTHAWLPQSVKSNLKPNQTAAGNQTPSPAHAAALTPAAASTLHCGDPASAGGTTCQNLGSAAAQLSRMALALALPVAS
jgi:hypothetical protein